MNLNAMSSLVISNTYWWLHVGFDPSISSAYKGYQYKNPCGTDPEQEGNGKYNQVIKNKQNSNKPTPWV